MSSTSYLWAGKTGRSTIRREDSQVSKGIIEWLIMILKQRDVDASELENIPLGEHEKGKTMIQHQLDKIEKRGEKRGKEIGKEIGEKLGEIKSKRESVLRFLQVRFGDMRDEIREMVHAVEKVDRLDELIDLAATCESLDDFAGKM